MPTTSCPCCRVPLIMNIECDCKVSIAIAPCVPAKPAPWANPTPMLGNFVTMTAWEAAKANGHRDNAEDAVKHAFIFADNACFGDSKLSLNGLRARQLADQWALDCMKLFYANNPHLLRGPVEGVTAREIGVFFADKLNPQTDLED